MKLFYLLITLNCAVFTMGFSQSETTILEGNYQGKNLYVQNPTASSGVGYCVTEVFVNGNRTLDETNSNAFEIDFKPHKLALGEKVEIKIKHKENCGPKVLNAEVLKPKSTFEIISMSIDKEGTLKWSTKLEVGKLPFVVEQFKWNKWVKVAEIEGLGTPHTNNYSIKTAPHAGKNTFRIRQTDYTGQIRTSKPLEFISTATDIVFTPAKVSKNIHFSADDKEIETMYEIYDQYGNIIKRGYGSNVDVSTLVKGGYFLNYDNKTGEFIKK